MSYIGLQTMSLNLTRAPHSDDMSANDEVTVERLERGIGIVAYIIAYHNAPSALPLLKRLEAERDRLLEESGAVEYAKRVLAQTIREREATTSIPVPLVKNHPRKRRRDRGT